MENKKELVVLWLDNHRDPEVWLAKKLASATHRRTLAFLNEKVYPHYSPRFVWVKNMREFQDYVRTHDMPGLVCFDHDLQEHAGDHEPDGRQVATWFVAYCKEQGVELPMCWVHSGNMYGAPQIRKILGINETEETNTMHVHEMIRDNYPEYYSIEERYPATQTVCIRGTKEEWGVFGNFYGAKVVVNGVTFDCTERLFQMMKLRGDVAEAAQDMMSSRYKGRGIKMHMKKNAKVHPEWFHDHWPSMIVDAMKYCLMRKYEQCELFRNELERSKGKFIVEDETTRISKGKDADTWGAVLRGDEYVGPSLLGRLLMELRDNGKLDYTLPADALDFINHLK